MPVARSRVSCRPKLDLPSDPSRSFSVLKPRKSSDLSVTSNLILLSLPLPTPGRVRLLLAGLLDRDLALVHHLLDEVLEQLVHLLRRQVLQPLHHLLEAVVVEQLALFERLLDRLLEILQRVLVPSRVNGMYCVLKPLSSRKSESAFSRSSPSIPRSSPVYFE